MDYVVGDIHGEYVKLQKLLNYILRSDANPSLIFVGDYLDKGQSSKHTLDFLVNLSGKYHCTFLTGNHEYIWLNLFDDFKKNEEYLLKYGAGNTIRSFECATLMEARTKMLTEYDYFFESLKSYWINSEFIVVHSGISVEDFDKDPDDIETVNFLFNRYEFIKHEGLFNGKYKVVFGHTGFFKPYVDPYKIGIDTAACFLKCQPLTAICLDNMYFYNSNHETYTVDYENFDFCPVIPRNNPWRVI
jgi:serine/threonine protein phosphatase 1